MTEDEALDFVLKLGVPRGTIAKLESLAFAVRHGSARQNLVASSTQTSIWSRHIADSMQLLALAPSVGRWIDIGSGAGFPGLVVASAWPGSVTLVEPRKLRAEFLVETARLMDLANVTVLPSSVEALPATSYDVISARAVAPLDRLFAMARHLAGPDTLWLLPKGARARVELAAARRSWQGDFRLVPSMTDSAAAIVVARQVERRK